MILSEDGKYVFFFVVGERYVVVWRVDGSKKQFVSCVFVMEYFFIFLDCRYMDNGEVDGFGFYVLVILEMGICYFWYGKDIEELRKVKSIKILLFVGDNYMKIYKGVLFVIFVVRI